MLSLSAKGLTHGEISAHLAEIYGARRRIGQAPLRWLFDLLRGPVATPGQRGTWWRGLLVCAIDGTTLTVPDSPPMPTRFIKG